MLKGLLKMRGLWALLGLSVLGAVFMLILTCCCGCRALKQLTKNTDSATHTNTGDTTSKVKAKDNSFHSHIETSELGYTGGGRVNLHLTAIDLQPTYTSVGLPVRRYFFADSGRMSAQATLNTDGSMDIHCKEDSFIAVINRMVKDSINNSHVYDSAYSAAKETISKLYQLRESETTIKQPWYKRFGDLLLAFVFGVGFGYLLHLIVKIEKLKRNGIV